MLIAQALICIGKVGIPDAILRKPARLDEDDYALMKKHPEYGWAVLGILPGFERAALDILHHHENFDGSDYPAGPKRRKYQSSRESYRSSMRSTPWSLPGRIAMGFRSKRLCGTWSRRAVRSLIQSGCSVSFPLRKPRWRRYSRPLARHSLLRCNLLPQSDLGLVGPIECEREPFFRFCENAGSG